MGQGGPSYAFKIHSPGRLCLIGEHVDYAGGESLGLAVRLGTTLMARPRPGPGLTVDSDRFDGVFDSSEGASYTDWRRYIQAFLTVTGENLSGWHFHLQSDLPDGAGMSSSASLLVALCLAADEVHLRERDPMEIAHLARRIENEGVGVGCGLLDQLSILYGGKQHIVHIHFDPPSAREVTFPSGLGKLLVIHTGIHRTLDGSGYNDRPKECAEALALLRRTHPGLKNLAQAGEGDAEQLPQPYRNRALHVIREVARVKAAMKAIVAEEAIELGHLINETHDSLSGLFDVSLPPIDALVEALKQEPVVLGARLMGGGFGGSVIAQVSPDSGEEVLLEMLELAASVKGIEPKAWLLEPAEGARVLPVQA